MLWWRLTVAILAVEREEEAVVAAALVRLSVGATYAPVRTAAILHSAVDCAVCADLSRCYCKHASYTTFNILLQFLTNLLL